MKSLTYATVTTLASCRNPVTERKKKKELLLPYLVDPQDSRPYGCHSHGYTRGRNEKVLLQPKSIDF